MRSGLVFVSITAFVCSFLPLGNAFANEKFVISYQDHPQIRDEYLPFIEFIYHQLSLEVEFIPVSIERGLIGVNSGLFDADVVRTDISANQYENVLVINAQIGSAELHLLCRTKLTCNSQRLSEPSLTLLASERTQWLLKEINGIEVQSEIALSDTYDRVFQLLRLERVDMALYPTIQGRLPQQAKLNFKVSALFEVPLFHVVNIRHKALSEKLTPLIQEHSHRLNE